MARGRAEVPGGAYQSDPAEVTPVTPMTPMIPHPMAADPMTSNPMPPPPIPPQPGPAEATHHFPSAPGAYPPVPGDERPVYPPPRRAERPHYDERIRYQRPFRFRQRQDERPGTGRAEAQFGPAEFGPPEYSPPNHGPVDHRSGGPRGSDFGGPPHSPAPWGAGAAPSPYGVQPPFGADDGAPAPYAHDQQYQPQPPPPPAPAFGWAAPTERPPAPPLPPGVPAEPPVVPAPLIPPPAASPSDQWGGGPWADTTWSAGTAQADPAHAGTAHAGNAHAGTAHAGTAHAGTASAVSAASAISAVSALRARAQQSVQQPPVTPRMQLPQRIPAEPDVPVVPGEDDPDGSAELPDIARIADYLRDEERDEELAEGQRRDGFDFPAVIEAVRGVVGVRDAELVTVDGTHTLRLDLADDADPGEVSRAVARLLKVQMGVSAEPSPPVEAEVEAAEVLADNVTDDTVTEDTMAESVTAGEAASGEAGDAAHQAAQEAVPEAAQPVEASEPGVEPGEATREAEATPAAGVNGSRANGVSAPALSPNGVDLGEPAELVPAIEPLPARMASLPRIGEPPTTADGIRVGTVPRDLARSGARAGQRPLESRLAAVEPPLSFDDWLETVRPGAPARPPVVEEAPQPDEHQSLVGMPTMPVFNDPLAPEPEPEAHAEPQPETQPETPPETPHEAHPDEPTGGPLVFAPTAPTAPAVQHAGAGGRVRLEQVDVANLGFEATVEVRLSAGDAQAVGSATGPAVDQFVLRLCATATASALDHLLVDAETGDPGGRCYVEHAAVVPLGTCEVAVVVLLLASGGGWVEQLTGSALVAGDARQAIVRATLAAANRRLDALLP